MKQENAKMSIKERVENFHNSEIELKSAIVNEIKSEFDKYNSDEVSLFLNADEYDFDSNVYSEWKSLWFCIPQFDDNGYGEYFYPLNIENGKYGLTLNCINYSYKIVISKYSELDVDMLYNILMILQLPIIKKINKIQNNGKLKIAI